MPPAVNLKKNPSIVASGRARPLRRLRSRKLQLVAVLIAAIAIAGIGSHVLVAWLKIETTTGKPWSVGPSNGKAPAFLAGSSLAGDGISWKRVSIELDQRIAGWGVAGASPVEMELFQRRAPEARMTFVVVSPYDLNESNLSDFRAEVVPLGHTVRELLASRADWDYSKRVLGQYPTRWLRIFFPTVGRSRGVMGELREKVSKLLGASAASVSEAGPTLSFEGDAVGKEYKNAKVSDWSEGNTLNKLTAMRGAFRGEQSFNGLKKRAFQRMLQYGDEKGRVVVVVLPVSPVYAKEFLTPKVARQLEDSLAEVRRSVPRAQWVHLDQLSALNSNDNFWDLVHLNALGRQIATDAFLSSLKQIESQ